MEVAEYGVCRLSVIPVRAEASHRSELVTQLLFGEHYEVTEFDKERKWCRIKIEYDQYQGWIEISQHTFISKEYFDYLTRTEFKITTDITATMLYNKSPMVVLMGSMIPISSSELFKMEEQFAFNGEAKNLGQKREFEYLKTIAFKYLNAPYQWGGRSPFGIDCSGFTQMVFKICGYKLFRDTNQQVNQGKLIEFENLKEGDLLYFNNKEGKIVHTGIALPDHKVIHASGRVRIDHLTDEGIVNSETKIFTHSLSTIKRVLQEV